MRISLILIVIVGLSGLFLWLTLSGALFVLASCLWSLLLIITIFYRDAAILYFLGAREVRREDVALLSQAVAQEAYKLSVSLPRLYVYNGSLERAFIFQKGEKLSLVLSKELLNSMRTNELSGICFALLLQAKKGMASSRTKVMFLIGTVSWLAHSIMGVFLSLVPSKEAKQVADWFASYLLNPWLGFLFKISLGKRYFKKLEGSLAGYPSESELLYNVGLKINHPEGLHSLPTKKLMELTSITKSQSFQSILTLEFLPHEWDILLSGKDLKHADQT